MSKYPESDQSVPAHYARAYAYHMGGYPDKAVAEVERAAGRRPHDPYFLELKGQILLEGGKPKEAIAPLREAAQRSGEMPLIAAMLGHALVATEDPKNFAEAKQVLKVAVSRDNEDPFAWYQLGIIYDREGDEARAALATAERSNLEDNPKLAYASAQMAMKGIPRGTPDYLRAQDIAMVSRAELAKKDKRYREGERKISDPDYRWSPLSAAAVAGGVVGSAADRRAAVLRGSAISQPAGSSAQGMLADPQILSDTVDALRDMQYAPVLAGNRAAIETPFASSWKGAAKPDVTLVEFFDYACPYCKASNPHVDRLLQEDKGLRVVYRELPILGPDSVTAARLSLEASKRPVRAIPRCAVGRRADRRRRPSPRRRRRRASRRRRPTTPRSRPSSSRNIKLAGQLGATGTPLFVIGDRVMNGAVGYDALKEAIAAARQGKLTSGKRSSKVEPVRELTRRVWPLFASEGEGSCVHGWCSMIAGGLGRRRRGAASGERRSLHLAGRGLVAKGDGLGQGAQRQGRLRCSKPTRAISAITRRRWRSPRPRTASPSAASSAARSIISGRTPTTSAASGAGRRIASYASGQPEWETVLDLDALAAAEKANWVWQRRDLRAAGRTALPDRAVRRRRGRGHGARIRPLDQVIRAKAASSFPRASRKSSWVNENSLLVAREWKPGELGQGRISLYRQAADAAASRCPPRSKSIAADAKDGGSGSRPMCCATRRTARWRWSSAIARYVPRRRPTFSGPRARGRSPSRPRRNLVDMVDGRVIIQTREEWTPAPGGKTFPTGSLLSVDLGAIARRPRAAQADADLCAGPARGARGRERGQGRAAGFDPRQRARPHLAFHPGPEGQLEALGTRASRQFDDRHRRRQPWRQPGAGRRSPTS